MKSARKPAAPTATPGATAPAPASPPRRPEYNEAARINLAEMTQSPLTVTNRNVSGECSPLREGTAEYDRVVAEVRAKVMAARQARGDYVPPGERTALPPDSATAVATGAARPPEPDP